MTEDFWEYLIFQLNHTHIYHPDNQIMTSRLTIYFYQKHIDISQKASSANIELVYMVHFILSS